MMLLPAEHTSLLILAEKKYIRYYKIFNSYADAMSD